MTCQLHEESHPMKITELTHDHAITLHLEGNFTYNQRRAFQEAIKKACQQNGNTSSLICHRSSLWTVRHWDS